MLYNLTHCAKALINAEKLFENISGCDGCLRAITNKGYIVANKEKEVGSTDEAVKIYIPLEKNINNLVAIGSFFNLETEVLFNKKTGEYNNMWARCCTRGIAFLFIEYANNTDDIISADENGLFLNEIKCKTSNIRELIRKTIE